VARERIAQPSPASSAIRSADARLSNEIEVFVQQQFDLQAGIARRIVGEREIDRAREDALGQRRRQSFDHRQMDARRIAPHRLHDVECDHRKRGVAEADTDRTGRGLVIGPDVLFRLAERRQHGAGVFVKPATGRGQRDPARPSFQQLDAQLGFERGDMVAQGGLRDVEHFRGARQHAGIGDRDEIPELPQSERH
jgi:hypothetical protein